MLQPLEFYDENIPCLAACPVNTNAGMYVAAIADGQDELAYLTARLPNPFASVCGRVCAAPCEDACRRGEIDRPIAIRALKRFVTEQFGTESTKRQSVGEGGRATIDRARRERRHRRWRAGRNGLCPRPASTGLSGHRLRSNRSARWAACGWASPNTGSTEASCKPTSTPSSTSASRFNTTRGSGQTSPSTSCESATTPLPGYRSHAGRGLDIEGHDADGVFKAIEFLINMNRGFDVEIGERVLSSAAATSPWTPPAPRCERPTMTQDAIRSATIRRRRERSR